MSRDHAVSTSRGRPVALSEVAARAGAGEPFDALVREFLDAFYGGSRPMRVEALAVTPSPVSPVHDAYLAAIGEHLARRFSMAVPRWVDEPTRFLREPFFAGGLENLKALLLAESPLAFRRRQIFVSKDALSRPRDAGSMEHREAAPTS